LSWPQGGCRGDDNHRRQNAVRDHRTKHHPHLAVRQGSHERGKAANGHCRSPINLLGCLMQFHLLPPDGPREGSQHRTSLQCIMPNPPFPALATCRRTFYTARDAVTETMDPAAAAAAAAGAAAGPRNHAGLHPGESPGSRRRSRSTTEAGPPELKVGPPPCRTSPHARRCSVPARDGTQVTSHCSRAGARDTNKNTTLGANYMSNIGVAAFPKPKHCGALVQPRSRVSPAGRPYGTGCKRRNRTAFGPSTCESCVSLMSIFQNIFHLVPIHFQGPLSTHFLGE
jgi:hypothetical protein